MVRNARKGMLFAGGLLLGVLAGAAGMMSLRGGDGPYASSPPNTRAMGAPASTAFVTAVAGNCEMAPMLPAAGDGDGKETLQGKPGEANASEIGALILSGKEAAASGRQRDAEIDFLNACRNAAALQDGNPIPLADSMYQLGRHYAMIAALGAAPKSRELFQRAERLYSASLEAYRARYGETGEKTRFAQQGLATVQQATGGKPPAVIAKAPPPAPAAPQPAPQAAEPAPVPAAPPLVATAPTAAPQAPARPAPVAKPAPAVAAAKPAHEPPVAAKAPEPPRPAAVPPQVATARAPVAPEPSPQPQQRRTTQPSFNCAQARSVPEKLICGDEELARLDRETGRLHQRARQAAADPRVFQRNSDAEWQQREETCRDKECLRAWYAKRQQELSEQAANAPARPSAVAPPPTRAAVQPRTATAMAHDERPAPVRPRPVRIAPRDDGGEPWTRTSGGPPATATAEGSPGQP